VAVLRGIHAPPGQSFDRVDAVADGVPVDAQSGGGGPPVAVVLEECGEPTHQFTRTIRGIERTEHRVGVGLEGLRPNGVEQ